jgi:hypothetical protein
MVLGSNADNKVADTTYCRHYEKNTLSTDIFIVLAPPDSPPQG